MAKTIIGKMSGDRKANSPYLKLREHIIKPIISGSIFGHTHRAWSGVKTERANFTVERPVWSKLIKPSIKFALTSGFLNLKSACYSSGNTFKARLIRGIGKFQTNYT
ncbi:hypothetical protein HUJ04_008785 [Dendroctonus ponderosae]|nr:hypothetical protein HUJ04_008785 [Dendroctonus ponderosae]